MLIFFLLLFFTPLAAETSLKTILATLNPTSVSEYLAFYELYPNTREGEEALERALSLLGASKNVDLPDNSILESIIQLANKPADKKLKILSTDELSTIHQLAKHLGNRSLKGFHAKTTDEVLKLDPEEIDLARGLFLSQMNDLREIESYEAMIDLMAIQIQATLAPNATNKEKVFAINRFIFDEMQFCFPPHSAYAKDIDLYTFLPSVLDSRRGVCLGVSILYLSLAQRLYVPLEIITPPGHIYVRYHEGDDLLNIETTLRGVHVDSEEYLGLNTKELQMRNLKETIGFAHVNKASLFWTTDNYQEARKGYETARLYIHDDPLVEELYAYSLILTGDERKGREILKKVVKTTPAHMVVRETLADDFLQNKVDQRGILATFMHVDEQRSSVLKKKEYLENILKEYPSFRSGWMNLGVTLLQLHREGEALEAFKKYHTLDKNNPTVEYILATLSAKRLDYNSAWLHLYRAEEIVHAQNHDPLALKQTKDQLRLLYPE